MDSLHLELEKIRLDRGMTNLQFAKELGVDHTVASRLCSGKKGVSHGLMSRLLVNLDAEDARRLLQAYFDDELARITEGRIEKARELGIRVPKKPWSFKVSIEDGA
jgi:transcriptional regulator with XRE-family HTH domain